MRERTGPLANLLAGNAAGRKGRHPAHKTSRNYDALYCGRSFPQRGHSQIG